MQWKTGSTSIIYNTVCPVTISWLNKMCIWYEAVIKTNEFDLFVTIWAVAPQSTNKLSLDMLTSHTPSKLTLEENGERQAVQLVVFTIFLRHWFV